MSDIQQTLNARESTHGSFAKNAVISQGICELLRTGPNWAKMPAYQREAFEMVAHKLARIVSGDCMFLDSVRDIIGYTQLVYTEMEKTDGVTDVVNTRVIRINGKWGTPAKIDV